MRPKEQNNLTRSLRFWPEGEVWFREQLSSDTPWSDDALLDSVPETAEGSYGVKVGNSVKIDGEHYQQGNIVLVDTRAEFERILLQVDEAEAFIFPWYDKLVPPALLIPHQQTIDLASFRKGLQERFFKALGITIAALAIGFYERSFLMIALLGATIYGLFPLVEVSMAWFRRVDQYSVDELNRRTVSGEFFRRWMLSRPTGILKVALAVLVLVFVGQLWVGENASIAKAALVQSAVLDGGEWWRTVTTGLMHGGVFHILFNGMALYSLGRVIVALVSPSLLVIVFFVSVITGSLASLWFGHAPASVGASGGILGCLGFLLVVCEKFKDELPQFLRLSCVQSAIVIAIFGLLGNSFIDNAAHAGGFIGGLILGVVFYKGLRLASNDTGPVVKAFSWVCLFFLFAGFVKIGIELWQLHGNAQVIV